jgi:hypothetical protein
MRILPAVALLLAVAGCGPDGEVRRYQAPKDPTWRMIGAIVSAKDATWFFKVTAPTSRIAAAQEEVLSFLRGLRVEEAAVRWTVPPGWKEEKGGPAREAAFKFGDREPKLEMTVVKLPSDGGGLAANVNRWREQVGLDRASEAEVAALVRKVGEAQVVDLIGPTRPAMSGGRPMARPPEPPPRSGDSKLDDVRAMFQFERPPSWRENPAPEKGRIYEFQAEEAGGSAIVSFTIMGGESGGLAANIDRWRTQVGLEPLGDQGIGRSATPMKFVGSEAWLVDVVGKDRAILGVVAISPQFAMFLKMDGPPTAVNAQRATFVRVAQSFQMRGRNE